MPEKNKIFNLFLFYSYNKKEIALNILNVAIS